MSNYPESFDDDTNLYLVHDALRLRLAEDYEPGDTTITVESDPIFDSFPDTGILTLTEQCSDIEFRAISFEYTGKGVDTFTGLTLLDNFTDIAKPKRITNVTLNVVAQHHNEIKDSVIAIEEFIGVQGEVASSPLSGTIEERINYLRELVLKPKAWFTADKHIGILPLTINFKDFSTRTPETWVWDFGDGDTETVTRSDTVTTGDVTKVYLVPGKYDITLTVTNDFGTDTIIIPEFIVARVEAPDEATIEFEPSSLQIYSDGVLRSTTNQIISVSVDDNGEQPLDSITDYIWTFSDDLEHDTTDVAEASYSIGGIYDIKLRANTTLGAYRITTFDDVIDIVEKFNIWHFIFDSTESLTETTKTLYVYEFGLLSETYKAAYVSSATSVTRNADFLDGVTNYSQQYAEFRRNNGFSPKSLTASGDRGSSVIYWSEGSDLPTDQQVIRFREFNGFDNTWTIPVLSNGGDSIDRQWNWLALDSGFSIFFTLGSPGPGSFTGSPTNQVFTELGLSSYSLTDTTFTSSNYENGANELMTNVGDGTAGNFSVYRGTWKDSNGYFVRNDGAGSFFRLKSFYVTQGTLSEPLQSITKLDDMPGSTKFEGQMVALSNGIYFFNNTGEVVMYNTTTNTWHTGGPGVNSPAFTRLQDTTVTDYNNSSNTLVATSDQSTKAYLFFDYSTRAQMKFNETDMTFTSLPVRPSGEQFSAGLY